MVAIAALAPRIVALARALLLALAGVSGDVYNVCSGEAIRIGDLKLLWSGAGFKRMIRENDGILNFALSTNASSTLALASKQLPLLAVGNELGVAAAGTFRLAAQLAQSLGKIGQREWRRAALAPRRPAPRR